jgi:hypothetical protein
LYSRRAKLAVGEGIRHCAPLKLHVAHEPMRTMSAIPRIKRHGRDMAWSAEDEPAEENELDVAAYTAEDLEAASLRRSEMLQGITDSWATVNLVVARCEALVLAAENAANIAEARLPQLARMVRDRPLSGGEPESQLRAHVQEAPRSLSPSGSIKKHRRPFKSALVPTPTGVPTRPGFFAPPPDDTPAPPRAPRPKRGARKSSPDGSPWPSEPGTAYLSTALLSELIDSDATAQPQARNVPRHMESLFLRVGSEDDSGSTGTLGDESSTDSNSSDEQEGGTSSAGSQSDAEHHAFPNASQPDTTSVGYAALGSLDIERFRASYRHQKAEQRLNEARALSPSLEDYAQEQLKEPTTLSFEDAEAVHVRQRTKAPSAIPKFGGSRRSPLDLRIPLQKPASRSLAAEVPAQKLTPRSAASVTRDALAPARKLTGRSAALATATRASTEASPPAQIPELLLGRVNSPPRARRGLVPCHRAVLSPRTSSPRPSPRPPRPAMPLARQAVSPGRPSPRASVSPAQQAALSSGRQPSRKAVVSPDRVPRRVPTTSAGALVAPPSSKTQESFRSTKDEFIRGMAPAAPRVPTLAPPPNDPASTNPGPPVEIEWEKDASTYSNEHPSAGSVDVEWKDDTPKCAASGPLGSASAGAFLHFEREGTLDNASELEGAPAAMLVVDAEGPSLHVAPAAASEAAAPCQVFGSLTVRKSAQRLGRVSIDFARAGVLESLRTVLTAGNSPTGNGTDVGPSPSHTAPAVISYAAESYPFIGSLAVRKSSHRPGRVSLDLRRAPAGRLAGGRAEGSSSDLALPTLASEIGQA